MTHNNQNEEEIASAQANQILDPPINPYKLSDEYEHKDEPVITTNDTDGSPEN